MRNLIRLSLVWSWGICFLVLAGAVGVDAVDRTDYSQKTVESVYLGRRVVMPDYGIGGTGGIGPGGADNWVNFL